MEARIQELLKQDNEQVDELQTKDEEIERNLKEQIEKLNIELKKVSERKKAKTVGNSSPARPIKKN